MSDRCVLAFDPGPKECGFAAATVAPGGRPRFVAGGNVPSDHDSLVALIERWVGTGPITIAIELPGSYARDFYRFNDLMNTRGVGERIATLAKDRDIPCVQILVQGVRRRLAGGKGSGRGTPGDAAVKRTLAMLVQDLPARTNVHLRDALALAVVVLLGTRLEAPTKGAALPKPWRPARRRR